MTSVNYADLTALARDLTAAAGNAAQATDDLLTEVGSQIEAEAIATVPVKTGKLRNNIRMISQPLRKVIGPETSQVPYEAFVEYGTGTRGEFPTGMYIIKPKTSSVLVFKVGGKTVYARSVRHPGISPHPYMRPALTRWVDSLGEDATKVGVQLIVGPNR